jgi:hypothetical protein
MRTSILVACVALVAGCEGKMKYVTGPEAIVWGEDYGYTKRFTVRGRPEMKGELAEHDKEVSLVAWGFPKGLEMQVGSAKRECPDPEEGGVRLTSDVSAKIAAMPAKDLDSGTLEHGLTLVMRPKGKPEIVVPLPPIKFPGQSVYYIFEKVAKGPVKFPGDKPRPEGKPRSVIDASMDPVVFGEAATLGDIDAVAVSSTLPEVKSTRQCGGYKDSSGNATGGVTLKLKETETVIYDRRTGAVLEKRRFAPKDECPAFAMVRSGDPSTDSSVPHEEVQAWLKAWIGGARPETVEAVAAPLPPR